ncbi:MAG: hypothetical protein K8R59_00555 [Thermoanaerobaculales bacterium]|nr:hypothetical protein [Thermoanaerobaculales bacterium]
MCSPFQDRPLVAAEPVPPPALLEPPPRRGPFPAIAEARVSKVLAAATGVSGSFARRQLRGEDWVPPRHFRAWLSALVGIGCLEVARSAVRREAWLVRCSMGALPEAALLRHPLEELADVHVVHGRLAALVARHNVDGIRTKDEVREELQEVARLRRELDEFEAALLAELETAPES